MNTVLKRYTLAALLLATFTLSYYAAASPADDLVGRWRQVEAGSSVEFGVLQFEKEGRLYVEVNQKGENSVLLVQYAVDEESTTISFSEALDFDPVTFAFEEDLLVLTQGDEEPLKFEKQNELRFYSSIAGDSEMHVMQIKSLDVNVEVFGERAITNVMYTIKNNHDEDLEAKIEIPLPEDALVVGYAIDINDAMIEGVAVPKAKARQAFEEIEDREVDPGIAEITRGNNFSTEIYPVPSKGTRKIRISYTHPLERNLIGNYYYQFPLSKIDSNAAVSISMSADGMRFIPLVKKSPFNKPEWEEANTGNRYYFADALPNSFDRIEPLRDLEVRFTPLKKSSAVIARARDGHRYLYSNLVISDESLAPIEAPTRISVLWDASASAEENHKDKLKLLAGFLKKIKKLKLENIELQLVVFANEILHEQVYKIGGVEDALVLAYLLENVHYDGATRYDLPEEAAKKFAADYSLLFSDGMSSLGTLSPIDLDKPLYVITASTKNNLPWLYESAYRNKGLLLDLTKLGTGKALDRIGTQLPALEMRVNGEVNNFEISNWLNLENEITLSVAAQLPKELEQMEEGTLSFSVANNMLHVANFEQKAVGEFARYDWLRLRLNNMSGDLVRNEELITKLGMEYSLATAYTSLVVLEDLDDYVTYGIQPPISFPGAKKYEKMRAEFLKDEKENEPTQENILAFLNDQWAERTEWWNDSKPMTLEKIEEKKKALAEKKKAEQEKMRARSSSENDVVEEVSVAGIRASLDATEDAASGGGVAVSLKPWSPDVPYIQRIKAGDPKGKKSDIDLYRKEKETFGESPAFYMDVAQYFFEKGEEKLAIRIMSNVLEINPENVALERMVAYNLEQFGAHDAAIAVLEHVKQLNAWEASSARDLAKVWEKKALLSKKMEDYQQTIDYYFEAITGPWDVEETLRVVALMELNHFLAKLKSEEMNIPNWKASLLKNLDVDVRIVLSWNSRVADIDLWVQEPSGEWVSYSNEISLSGGTLPYDVTDGFGPEEYLTRFALEGDYEIFVDLYSNRSVELFGPITLTLDLYTNYGREDETLTTTSVRLKEKGERIPIGKITWH